MMKKRPSNKGKKRIWRCFHVEHYYDDFMNTHLCHAPQHKGAECEYRGNMLKMHKCQLFRRGDVSCYVDPKELKD